MWLLRQWIKDKVEGFVKTRGQQNHIYLEEVVKSVNDLEVNFLFEIGKMVMV